LDGTFKGYTGFGLDKHATNAEALVGADAASCDAWEFGAELGKEIDIRMVGE
jgi:hypothetical protein